MTDQKIITDVCLISKQGVCLLDMRQVAEKAREMGFSRLAELVEDDLESNRITDGQYYPVLASLMGVPS